MSFNMEFDVVNLDEIALSFDFAVVRPPGRISRFDTAWANQQQGFFALDRNLNNNPMTVTLTFASKTGASDRLNPTRRDLPAGCMEVLPSDPSGVVAAGDLVTLSSNITAARTACGGAGEPYQQWRLHKLCVTNAQAGEASGEYVLEWVNTTQVSTPLCMGWNRDTNRTELMACDYNGDAKYSANNHMTLTLQNSTSNPMSDWYDPFDWFLQEEACPSPPSPPMPPLYPPVPPTPPPYPPTYPSTP